MNLSQQTLRNMTTQEILSSAESVDNIDRLTFSYISEKIQSDFQDVQDELEQTQEELEEAEDSLKDAAKAFRKIREMSEELLEDERYVGMNDLERLLVKINMLADAKVDKIGDY